MQIKIPIIKIVLIALLLFCGTALAGIHRHDAAAEKFIALGQEPQFECVVQLKKGEAGAGSAVFLSPHWALTSAHIFDNPDRPQDLTVIIGEQVFQIEKIVVHPDFKNKDSKFYTDLALIKLKSDYTGKTAKIYNRQPEIGGIVTIVGYGRFRGAFDKEAGIAGKRAGQNVIDTIGGEKLPDNFLGLDLSDPRAPATDKSGNKIPLELEYVLEGGDSGGGAFVSVNGNSFLIGINTRSIFDREKLMKFDDFGFYGTTSYLTGIFAYQKWIQSTIENGN